MSIYQAIACLFIELFERVMNSYWSDKIHGLKPYVPGEQPKKQNLTKLNTNENPYPPSSKVLAAIQAATGDSLRLYPDPESIDLKQALSNYHQVMPNQVFVGNGSDEVLAHIFYALLQHNKPILFPDISYSFYPVYCELYGVEFETVPLNESFDLDVADYKRDNGGIIFPNPNAPTGKLLPLSDVEAILDNNANSVVVVDEAYIDFGGQSAVCLVDRYPNLVVTRTFSKSRSLAGLRVGYAIADAGLIEALQRVKNSFNSYPLDRLAQVGAIASLDDDSYFQQVCEQVIKNREQLIRGLESIGFQVLPSRANFIFASHPDNSAEEIAGILREKGVIVRHFRQARISNYLRISVGSEVECQALLQALCE
jgi:histidinol-phosphate aminotransferase